MRPKWRLELTVEIDDLRPPSTFISRVLSWFGFLGGTRLVKWRVIEDPDPNEEHSGG